MNKEKKLGLKPHYYWGVVFLSILLKCLFFQYTTGLNQGMVFSETNLNMLLSTIGVLLLLFSVAFIIFNHKRHTLLLCGNIFVSMLLFADTIFFRYYYGLITIPVLEKFNVSVVGSVHESFFVLFSALDLLYFIDLPLLFLLRTSGRTNASYRIPFKKKIAFGVVLGTIGCILFISAFTNADVHAFAYNDNYVTKDLGVLYTHIDSTVTYAKKTLLEDPNISLEEEQELDTFFVERPQLLSDLSGTASGMNLIIIQAEALQGFVIDKWVGDVEITPNLNQLIHTSLYFDNIYYQTADGNTSDAEFLCNTSLYPLKEGSVFHKYDENYYESLPKMMKQQGYDTYALHAFPEDFWNRPAMYDALGFDRYVNHSDYEMDDFAGWHGQALSDISFFRQSLDIINTSRPFYSFFVTLSSHYPYSYFQNYAIDTGEWEGTLLGNYINAMHYNDKAIGGFIEDLKQRGLYENSLIVIYGDHSGIPKVQSEELISFLAVEENDWSWTKLQKVPLIIHLANNQEARKISITGAQIDILPTLTNLMGMEAPYALGKDLLTIENGYAVLRNGTLITDDLLYLNDQRLLYDASSGMPMDLETYQEFIHDIQKELSISDLIIEKDALRPD